MNRCEMPWCLRCATETLRVGTVDEYGQTHARIYYVCVKHAEAIVAGMRDQDVPIYDRRSNR